MQAKAKIPHPLDQLANPHTRKCHCRRLHQPEFNSYCRQTWTLSASAAPQLGPAERTFDQNASDPGRRSCALRPPPAGTPRPPNRSRGQRGGVQAAPADRSPSGEIVASRRVAHRRVATWRAKPGRWREPGNTYEPVTTPFAKTARSRTGGVVAYGPSNKASARSWQPNLPPVARRTASLRRQRQQRLLPDRACCTSDRHRGLLCCLPPRGPMGP